jgi:UDP-N-acetylglucosamine:LPS N-acetylglucosamine transferase
MKPKTVYLVLCVLGLVLPYWQFVPWVAQHGVNLPLFVRELFANRISAFFGMDVLVSAVVLFRFIGRESSRLTIRTSWFPMLAVLTVGVSLGLPLFLYLREARLEQIGMGAEMGHSKA